MPGSPQDMALQWLIDVDTETNGCNGPDGIAQRYILAVFYFSTNGITWSNKASWLGPSSECTWYGVTCVNGVSILNMGTYHSR